MTIAGRIGSAALELVFPSRCLGCGANGSFLCDACAASLTPALPPRCLRCWEPRSFEGVCLSCQATPPAFDGLRSAFVYQGLARDLVHALKYRGVTAVADRLALSMAEAARAAGLTAEVVVPVPLAWLRERTRGYNQAQALARPLARELGVSLARRALRRRRHTASQARSATAEERRRNVAGAFRARPEPVAGRAVLLVDDIATTGATLSACAEALREAGARSVWALTFARED